MKSGITRHPVQVVVEPAVHVGEAEDEVRQPVAAGERVVERLARDLRRQYVLSVKAKSAVPRRSPRSVRRRRPRGSRRRRSGSAAAGSGRAR